MFVQLGRPRAHESLADDLLACHERIRRFAALAVRISGPVDATEDEVAEAARSVHRYFTVALPLHVADEDDSLAPRLVASAPAVALALETMTAEHIAIEELLGYLAPLWSAAASKRAGAAELAAERDAVESLEALLARHLELEEVAIFPALRGLAPATSAAIVAEMRARRPSHSIGSTSTSAPSGMLSTSGGTTK